MSKIVFLDVDGTLIDYEAKLPASAREAVNKAADNGHRVYICTGCSKYEIMQRDLPEKLSGMIGGNGAYVEDNGKVVMHQALSADEVQAITDWLNERQAGFYMEANSGMYINKYFLEQGPEAFARYREGKGDVHVDREAMRQRILKTYTLCEDNDFRRSDVNKISFVLKSYQDHLDSKERFPQLIANTWGGKGELALFGDLGPAGITKKHAISVLLDYLHADRKDTISFGDAKIDLSMFELCAFNVAMGNGGEEIKAAADYVTDDVNKDGLYNAFKYLKLI